MWVFGLDFTGWEYSPEAGSEGERNEYSGIIKSGEFFERFSDYHIVKKDSVPWS
jgi:hypothetical protein